MHTNIIALVSGIIFGIGLCVSQMVNPAVVIGFLDVTGDWDPRLAFVMIGALLVTGTSFPLILKRRQPLCAAEFSVPANKVVDRPLVLGAVLFGIGWGLSGICPGPAVTALAFGLEKSVIFAVAMFAGMGLFKRSRH